MSLAAGTRLGPYEIGSPIGKGGMGEVYRARDTKLDREVAIKVLPEEFAKDKERLARFEREAKLLASLNHPNIASIYGLEESDGVKALVLELVEGPTLAERIAEGPIPVEEAIAIAKQIAQALEAGHEAGVIHRDLKPANVKLKEDGTVKVLDYGLAKALEGEVASEADSALSQSPTLTRQGTQIGVILGTAAYMSPEQAKGKRVDRRTDIWAFGAVVYEMLTGKRAFGGADVSDTLAAVLRAEPDFHALPADTPEALRNVLRLCMTKDAKERVHDIADVRLAMKGAFGSTTRREDVVSRRFSMGAAVAVVLGALVAGLFVWSTLGPDPTPAPVVQFSVTPPGEPMAIANQNRDLVVTPDGTKLVYFSGNTIKQLYVWPLADLEGAPIRQAIQFYEPFTSPDGMWIGFMDESTNALKKVSILGGAPVAICDVPSGQIRGATWSPDGTIIFGTLGEGGLWRVSADGGEPEALAVPDPARGETGYFWPAFLPGGRALVYTIYLGSPYRQTGNRGVSLSSEDVQLAVLELDTNEHTRLVPGSSPHYSPTGHLVYGLGTRLWAVRFDADRLKTIGDPIPVLDGVATKTGGGVDFSVSNNGLLAYVPLGPRLDDRRTLVWVDRKGREEALPAEPRRYLEVRLSPDGRSVALDVNDRVNRDVWIYDLLGNRSTRLTFDIDLDSSPVWAPDGSRIFTGSGRFDARNLFWKEADGTGEAVRLTDSPVFQIPTDVSRDGMVLIFNHGFRDVGMLSLEGNSETEMLIATGSSEGNAVLSPDNRWIAYESDESGQVQIYVRPFPDVDAGRSLVSEGAGIDPLWSPDGRELFYRADGVFAVPVETSPTFVARRAVRLFENNGYLWSGRTYDVSPDGQQFLMIKRREGEEVEPVSPKLVVVLNWHEELKRLVPNDD